ncbi:MAG: hypothetical protein BWY76_00400 [bacterium ADurb.Bin429]|nr:MAG: hypothetical protein BWY76_00400 [bacterium ADurb.Bin429]
MKTTLLSAIALAILALGVLLFRGGLQKNRETCGARLEEVAVALEVYASEHNHRLPSVRDDLDEILGLDTSRYTGAVALGVKRDFKWKRGEAIPYLWDKEPHPFIGGYHILYTDGEVTLEETPPVVETVK